jgi:hypothetical protein
LNGTVELVLVEVRQTIISKSPYPGFWCSRAFGKTETDGSVVPNTIGWTIRVHGDFWPQALSGGAEIGIREVTIGVNGKVSRALTRLGVDIVYLRRAIFVRERIRRGGHQGNRLT